MGRGAQFGFRKSTCCEKIRQLKMEKDLKRALEKSDEAVKMAKLETTLPTPDFPVDLDNSVTCSVDKTPGRVSTRKNRRKSRQFRDSNGNRPLESKKLDVENLAAAMEVTQVNQKWHLFNLYYLQPHT